MAASTTPPPALPTPAAGSAISLTDRYYVSESCLDNSAFYDISTKNGLGDDDNFYVRGPRQFQSACFPPDWQASTGMWYSPGICPSRYTSACDTTNVAGSLTQTRVTCCPEIGVFTCFPESEMAKSSNFPWHSTFGCVSYFSSDLSVPIKQKIGYTSTTEVKSDVTIRPPGDNAGTINAFSVQVAYQSGDKVSPKGGGSEGNGNDDNTTNGLTTSAAIGIGVGVGVAAILILISCFILWRRRRRQLSSSSSATTTNQDTQQQQQQQEVFLPPPPPSSVLAEYSNNDSPEYNHAMMTPHTQQQHYISEHHKLYGGGGGGSNYGNSYYQDGIYKQQVAEAPTTTLEGGKPVSELPGGGGGGGGDVDGTDTNTTTILPPPPPPPVEMPGDNEIPIPIPVPPPSHSPQTTTATTTMTNHQS